MFVFFYRKGAISHIVHWLFLHFGSTIFFLPLQHHHITLPMQSFIL